MQNSIQTGSFIGEYFEAEHAATLGTELYDAMPRTTSTTRAESLKTTLEDYQVIAKFFRHAILVSPGLTQEQPL